MNGRLQLTLFETVDHPLLDAIRDADLDQLSPREVVQLVEEWQSQLAVELTTRQRSPKPEEALE
jgi:hypothetical protein